MYRLTSTDVVLRLFDGLFIPADPENADRRAFLEWMEGGGVPEPVDEAVVGAPQLVTRFQARAALHLAGLLPQVEALMANPELDPLALLAWTDAQEFKRSSPTLLGMASALGLTEQQLDELFIAAAEIEA